MNCSEYINHLTNWLRVNNYEPKQCHVSHGGSMLLTGLRDETDDIDLTVSQEIWDDLISKGYVVKTIPANNGYPEVNIIVVDEYIDVHLIDSNMDFSNKLLCRDSIWYRNLETTLSDKLKLNRTKDQKDIELLKQHLK